MTHSHNEKWTQIVLPDGICYRACTCGAKLLKHEKEFRELEIAHVRDAEYSVKLKGDTMSLKNRLAVEKGTITEEIALDLEAALKP